MDRRTLVSGALLMGAAPSVAASQTTPAAQGRSTGDEARTAIADALARYCRAWDRCDVELALTVWHPDGTAQYLAEPVAPVASFIPQRLNGRRDLGMVTSHQITSMVVHARGDRAASEAYGTAWTQQRTADGQVKQHHYFHRYLDRWSRRAGVWAIDHRRVILDGYSVQIVVGGDPALDKALGASRSGPDDPSYAHFADFESEA